MANLHVAAIGMVTPVGVDAAQSCASMRAGIHRFRELEDYLVLPDESSLEEGEHLIGARVPLLQDTVSAARAPGLLLAALQELIDNAAITRRDIAAMRLFIVLPGNPAQREFGRETEETLRTQLRAMLGRGTSEPVFINVGKHGVYHALQQATLALNQGSFSGAVLLNVDTLHDRQVLNALDHQGRLKSARNLDGLIPGEAAVALLLRPPATHGNPGTGFALQLGAIGIGTESNTIASDLPSSGTGLSEAIRAATGQDAEARPISWVACDLNGESYRAREWGLSRVRLGKLFADHVALWHPADCIGDVGVASGGVLLAMVIRALQHGYAPSSQCLVWSSDDQGTRAAVLVRGVSH